MDTTARRRKIVKEIEESSTLNNLYPYDVNMYTIPPVGEISLEEFEHLAYERLQVLRIIDQASAKGHKMYSEDWKKYVKENLIKAELKKFLRLLNGGNGQSDLDFQARRADHISHFILRLAYCRSEDLRRWFLGRELEWFKLRSIMQNQKTLTQFFESNGLIYIPITDSEKDEIHNELLMSTANMSDINVRTTSFFKVPFKEVFSLIKNRRVFLKEGYAYVPVQELIVCVQAFFRAKLNQALTEASQRLPSLDDDRITTFLLSLNNAYIGKDYSTPSTNKQLDPMKLDIHAKKHYPMCMSHLHETLKANHHLKYNGRLHYGLFLKGIGLSYEDALAFWREEFTKAIDGDKFEKSYSYIFKHQYGKVGSMVNYSPYSCLKIITTNVGPGEHHGCPFKNFDPSQLKRKMMDSGISSDGIATILELSKNGHFQIACTRYFEHTHALQPPSKTIDHPNQYYEDSINLTKKE